MKFAKKKIRLKAHLFRIAGAALALNFAISPSVNVIAQTRSTTDWVKANSSVIKGDYAVTHYLTTYYMESNSSESWKAETIHQGEIIYTQHGYSVMEYTSGGTVVASTGRCKATYGNLTYRSSAILWQDGFYYHHQAYCGIDMTN